MGKLYENVKFLNYLKNNLDDLRIDSNIKEKLLAVEKIKRSFPEHSHFIDPIVSYLQSLEKQELAYGKNISDQISNVEKLIDQTAYEMVNVLGYAETFDEIHFGAPHKSFDLIITSEIRSIIEAKITGHCDWHFPALNINPTDKTWIDAMVAADPLYLTHNNIRLVKNMISSYPELYQNRLRLYETQNRNFSKLPQNQFSFIFCWNSFNYLNLEKIEKYLIQCWDLLRPGGVFLFSYSNCDLEIIAVRAELGLCAYCNSRWISDVSKKIGFEIIRLCDLPTGDDFNTHVSFVELKKPGILKTVKASQAMAQIISK